MERQGSSFHFTEDGRVIEYGSNQKLIAEKGIH